MDSAHSQNVSQQHSIVEDNRASAPILVVAGARPNFMNVVPILREIDRRRLNRLFVHTDQHYDMKMYEDVQGIA